MSFSCPHFRPEDERCLRLDTDCVPGRRGCVIGKDTVFAVPAEVRVREKEEEKRRAALEAAPVTQRDNNSNLRDYPG